MMTKKKKTSPVGTIVFLVLLAGVIIGGYLMITRNKDKNDSKEIPVESSEADTLIKKDLFFEYPSTPREVLKLYCRITKCLYNDELTDDQMRKLVSQVRLLYTPELLDANDEDEQLAIIKGDITEYRKAKKVIYAYTIDSSNNLETIDTKAGKTTLIKMFFTLKAGGEMNRAYEEFSLVMDENGKWKIAGWKVTEAENFN